MSQGNAPQQGGAVGLQQGVQNFLAQHPQALQIPPAQLVAAVVPPVVPPPAQPTRRQLIAQELQSFLTAYPDGATIAANLPAAWQLLQQNLANVQIDRNNIGGSKQANQGVEGLWIGELIDTMRTLHKAATQPGTPFYGNKFWTELNGKYRTLSGIDGADDDDDDDDSG